MKFRVSAVILLILGASPRAESAGTLLSGYLENDLQLRKFVVTAESKSLSLSSARISNGVAVKLSTGNVQIRTTAAGRRRISVSPQAELSVPQAALTAKASVPVTISDGESSVSDGSLSATVGIVTDAREKRRVTILEAERALLEAERNVRDRAVSAEREFYTSLKALYQAAASAVDAGEDLLDDEASLRVLVAKGYSRTSAPYRQAALKVETDRRGVQEKQRIFLRKAELFARKCGTALPGEADAGLGGGDSEAAFRAAVAFLPDSVPREEPEDVLSRDGSRYTASEKARWERFINALKRGADGGMTLSATGEYKLNDSFCSSADGSGSDSAGGKLTFAWRGISASAGAYFPTGTRLAGGGDVASGLDPYLQFSLAFSPNEWRLASIQRRQDALSASLDEIAVSSAEDEYESKVAEMVTEFRDIQWAARAYAEELETYSRLEEDMARWLRQGSVTEADWRSARNGRDKARLNVLVNALDLLIFNGSVRLMFREEGGE